MTDTAVCYICDTEAPTEATVSFGAHQWSIPLCLDHSATSLSLLRRMFNSAESDECWITVVSDAPPSR
jgi:hypothetical protein